jgi:hypothetical protein
VNLVVVSEIKAVSCQILAVFAKKSVFTPCEFFQVTSASRGGQSARSLLLYLEEFVNSRKKTASANL